MRQHRNRHRRRRAWTLDCQTLIVESSTSLLATNGLPYQSLCGSYFFNTMAPKYGIIFRKRECYACIDGQVRLDVNVRKREAG